MKPKTYLFPGMVNNWRADVPITEKIVWDGCGRGGQAVPASRSTYLRIR